MSRTCEWCRTELPADARKQAKFCAKKCKDAAAYRRNGERARLGQAAYRAANREKRAAYDLARRLADPETSKARHRASYANDPTPYKSSRDKRRTLAASATEYRHVSGSEWNALLRRHGGCCAYCGSAERIEMDHVVPLSRGGRHAIGNLLPACFDCNRSKRAKFLSEWKLHRLRVAAFAA